MHFLHALVVAAAVGGHAAAMPDRGLQAQPHRVLKAATKRADLYRRSVRITKRFETEMSYVDRENIWSDASIFASQVKVGSQKPVLNLEEHEHHLQAVKCDANAMKLHFVDTSSARDARAAYDGETGGLIITSHEGCNEEGERSVYRVNDVSFAEDGEALEVSVVKTTWREAFDHVNVTFGHTTDDHIYRRHSDFARIRGKRQNRVNIPQDTPDNVQTARFDLNSEIVDKTFIATDFLDIIGGIAPLPELPVNIPIELGCKRCATTGQLELSQGAFNIDLSQIDLIPDIFQGGDDGKEISSVITGGFMELVATGVGARLDLFARPSANGAFEVALFQLPIAGFTIPGIGQAGAVFEPRVNFEFEVTGGLELNYGLELKVPDGSSIRVELTNLGNSRITGFQDTSLTPLPVTVNITDVDILLGLAFKPSIPVGFEFLDQLKAEVSATLELPRLDAKLSSNIAANCGNGTNVTTPAPPPPPPVPALPPFTNSTVQRRQAPITLGPLALVEANVSISCDLSFDVAIPILPPPFNAVSVAQNIFKAEFPLVSECKSPERAFEDSLGVVIPAPPPSAIETSAPVANATAIPENPAPALNVTTSATVSSTITTSATVSLSTPSFQNTSASATSPSFTAPPPLNITTTFSAPSPLNTTVASSSTAAFLNATTTSSSDSLPLNTTVPSVPAPSFLNTTTTLASSTALASSSVVLNTTTALASSTVLASSSVGVNTTTASNFTTPTTSTLSVDLSTTVLTTTSSIASQTPTTTETPSVAATTLDPNFSFSLFSTTRRTRPSSTEEAETSTSEAKSSAEATSTQESSAPSASSTEAQSPVETTATPENSSSSTSPSASSPAPSADTSSTESAVTSASSTPASSSDVTSSASASSAPSSPIVSSQPAASPTLVIPALPPFAPEALQSLAATVTVAAGFLMPTNASALPAVQTNVQTFNGAAARGVDLPSMANILCPLVGFIAIWMI